MSTTIDEQVTVASTVPEEVPAMSGTVVIYHSRAGLNDRLPSPLHEEASSRGREDDEQSSDGSETGSNAAEQREGGAKRKVVAKEIPLSAMEEKDLLAIFGPDLVRSLAFRIPRPDERPWDAPDGFVCLYECYFNLIGLWFPLPKLLTDLCMKRRVAISQLAHSAIRHVVGMLTIATEIGVEVDHEFFDEMCSFTLNRGIEGTLYVKARKGLSFVEAQRSNLHGWWKRYFFVEVSPLTIEDPKYIPRTSWNMRPNFHLLIRGPPEHSSLKAKKIVAAAIEKNPEAYERRILAAVARMGRGRAPGRAPVTGKFKILKSSDKKASRKSTKRAANAVAHNDGKFLARLASGGKGIMTQEGNFRLMESDAPSWSPRKRTRRDQQIVRIGEDVAGTSTPDSLEGEHPSFLVDFRYPGGKMLCSDGDACARLASQLVMTEYPFPPVERLAFAEDYKIMLKSLFRGLGRTNFIVSNYEELVKDLEEQITVLTGEKAKLEEEATRLKDVNAEAMVALEIAEEKCSVLNQRCGFDPDNVLLGDESLGGWKSRGTLTAELEASRQELQRYRDFEAVVASYLADRDMSVDAVSLLSEKFGAVKALASLEVDGALVLPEHYEAAKADFERQRAVTADLEVVQLEVEDLPSDDARKFVLSKRAEQEKIRAAVKGGKSVAVGSDEGTPLRIDAIDSGGEQSLGRAADVGLGSEFDVPGDK